MSIPLDVQLNEEVYRQARGISVPKELLEATDALNLDIDGSQRQWISDIRGALQQQQEIESTKPPKPKIAREKRERVISRACREVIDNPKASPKDKLRAATILEKLVRAKDLASKERKRNLRQSKTVTDINGRIGDILRRTGTD